MFYFAGEVSLCEARVSHCKRRKQFVSIWQRIVFNATVAQKKADDAKGEGGALCSPEKVGGNKKVCSLPPIDAGGKLHGV